MARNLERNLIKFLSSRTLCDETKANLFPWRKFEDRPSICRYFQSPTLRNWFMIAFRLNIRNEKSFLLGTLIAFREKKGRINLGQSVLPTCCIIPNASQVSRETLWRKNKYLQLQQGQTKLNINWICLLLSCENAVIIRLEISTRPFLAVQGSFQLIKHIEHDTSKRVLCS